MLEGIIVAIIFGWGVIELARCCWKCKYEDEDED